MKWFKPYCWLVVQIGVLLLPALYNTFPFISGDTSAYIESAIQWQVPAERPIFYSIFIRLTSLGMTLWGVVIAQNIILRYLLKKSWIALGLKFTNPQFTGLLLALVLVTGVGWESSKVLADIFVGFIFLCAIICIYPSKLNRLDLIFVPLIYCFSATTHYSHLVIALCVSLILLIFRWRNQAQRKWSWGLLTLSLTAIVLVMGSNSIAGHGFRLSRASSVFITGKMVENGIVPTYLADYCEEEDWSLCQYKDSLPVTGWQFVWDPHSPLQRTGGWQANEDEYSRMIKSILTKPKYLGIAVYKSVENTAIQLVQWTCGDNLFRYEEGSNVQQAIKRQYPLDYPRSMWSKQYLVELDFKGYGNWYILIFIGLIIGYCWNGGRWAEPTLIQILLMLFVFIVLNAAITSNFSNISSRLQWRVMWLPVWFMLLGMAKRPIKLKLFYKE